MSYRDTHLDQKNTCPDHLGQLLLILALIDVIFPRGHVS